MPKFLLVASLIWLITVSVYSQTLFSEDQYSKYRFKALTMDDGLSNYKVNAICKDSSGFIWFGTNEGLDRFDGFNFRIFKHNTTGSNSISSNTVRKILVDNKGKLIIATDEGVDVYDPNTEVFEHLKCNTDSISTSLSWTICLDKNNTLWVGDRYGVFYKRENDLYLTPFFKEVDWLENWEVTEIECTADNQILIGTKRNGLFIYNQNDKSYRHFYAEGTKMQWLSGNWIEALFQDSRGNLWVGTNDNGLNVLEKGDSVFKVVHFKELDTDNVRVRDVVEDQFGRLWLGSYAGLLLKDTNQNEFKRYAHVDDISSTLTNNSIYDLYVDDMGMLWVGTYSGGVNYCDMFQKKFKFYEYKKGDNRYLDDRVVYAIAKDSKGNLWVGTERGGLNKLNAKTHSYEYFYFSESELTGNNIKAILLDSKENLWIGTYKNGLIYFNTQTNQFLQYKNNPNDSTSLGDDIVYSLCYDKDSNLWIGTRTGLDLLKKRSHKFRHISNNISPNRYYFRDVVHTLYIDSKDELWIGTAIQGLFKFDKTDSIYKAYDFVFQTTGVFTIYEDRNGNLWTGGNSGLYYINDKSHLIKHYNESDGLPINTIFKITGDKQGNLWISTTIGITKFIDAVDHPYSPNFVNFKSNDGLQIKQFTHNSTIKNYNDELFFGGVNGFISFNPENITNNPFMPKVIITDLKIYNERVAVGKPVSGEIILNQSISTTRSIELNPHQKVFTIEFAALHYSFPEKIKYKYKLEGFDNDWIFTDYQKRSATYTNLDGGTYRFLVSATNNDGVWTNQVVSLNIKVIPPFWKNWWFISLLILLVTLFVLFIFRIRTIALQTQKHELETKVRERTFELSKANHLLEEKQLEISSQNVELSVHRNHLEQLVAERTNELERQKRKAEDADRLKSAFLANMSHEIRTPLNSILGFSSLLVGEDDNKTKMQYHDIISSNSEALLVLINDILDISKIESNQLKIFKAPFDIVPLLNELESTYLLKSTDQVKVELMLGSVTTLKLNNDSIRLKQVISNLIDNALKYTEHGFVRFGINVRFNQIVFFVEDSGIGISKDKFSTVFNHFEKIEETREKVYRGAGIGLAISKRLVELMGGEIWLESEVNKGSIFYVSFPLIE